MDKVWGKEGPDEEAQTFLNVLREKDLPGILPKSNITEYKINWSENGVDPEKIPAHKTYIENLTKDFYSTLTGMITDGITEKADADISEGDDTTGEIFQHLTFCQKKIRGFHGRRDVLDAVKEGVQKESPVMVLHGVSGSGKTSVMAKVASQLRSWWKEDDCVVIVRFIGTTLESSSVTSLVQGLCQQMYAILGKVIGGKGENAVENFPEVSTLPQLTRNAFLFFIPFPHFDDSLSWSNRIPSEI